MKRLLLFLATIIMAMNSYADVVKTTIGLLTYSINMDTKTAEITHCDTIAEGDMNIPGKVTYEGVEYSVTSIGEKCFDDCLRITSIEIPSGVTTLKDACFASCSHLKTISIPKTVTKIAPLGSWLSLNRINIEDLNVWCNPNNKIDLNVAPHDIYLNNEKITNLVIPGTIDSLSNYAFAGSTIKSVVVEDGVKYIGNRYFQACRSLESVVIPNSLKEISKSLFESCKSLKSIVIPNSVEVIRDYAFWGCI